MDLGYAAKCAGVGLVTAGTILGSLWFVGDMANYYANNPPRLIARMGIIPRSLLWQRVSFSRPFEA